jgi:glycogen debranching enzyme
LADLGVRQYPITARAAPPDDRTRVLKYGVMFGVFDRYGDVEPVGLAEQGIFYMGTRHLSQFTLQLGGTRPLLLSSTVREDNSLLTADLANVDLEGTDGRAIRRGTILITRSKFLWDAACYEKVRIRNYGQEPVATSLEFVIDGDFADIFEVRGTPRARKGERLPDHVRPDCIQLEYRGLDHVLRLTRIHFDREPEEISPGHCRFPIRLGPKESLTFEITVACSHDEAREHVGAFGEAFQSAGLEHSRAGHPACEIYSSNQQFNDWMRRSVADLEMMIRGNPEPGYPYAGVPWFSTVFGRDGIITAMQALWVQPEIARGVLEFLAATQATEVNPRADAEPGKIVHETRRGEMAALGEVPFWRYYGSIDSTPLFLMLAEKYYRRTGDLELIHQIWPQIKLALRWIDEYGDVDGDGFVEYARRSDKGLVQQGWKDSNDSIFYADGRIAEPPIALCEVQGYVYAAKRGIAYLARAKGDAEMAHQLASDADQLRENFQKTFWCPEINCYALALDGKKNPCRVRSSNAGHCLFTGIADPEHAAAIAREFATREFQSGWGIRTLSSKEVRYNPASYHNGSVWPHDNSLIVAGLAAYGYSHQAAELFSNFLDVSMFVDLHRLPELFCGLKRLSGESPTLYPVACSPQSWSAGAVFLLLQSCLGLTVDGIDQHVVLQRPYLPEAVAQVWIKNLKVNGSLIDLFLERSGDTVRVHRLGRQSNVRVTIQ